MAPALAWEAGRSSCFRVVRSFAPPSRIPTGAFNFLGLGMGTYTIQEVQQAGWVAQSGANLTATLALAIRT